LEFFKGDTDAVCILSQVSRLSMPAMPSHAAWTTIAKCTTATANASANMTLWMTEATRMVDSK